MQVTVGNSESQQNKVELRLGYINRCLGTTDATYELSAMNRANLNKRVEFSIVPHESLNVSEQKGGAQDCYA